MVKKEFDFEAVKELDLVISNEHEDYKREQALAKNYGKRWKKGTFNFQKAQQGVKNLVVVPRVRKYQKQFRGMKIGNSERDAIAKARLRAIMRSMKE